jgi:hypothetical protein
MGNARGDSEARPGGTAKSVPFQEMVYVTTSEVFILTGSFNID